jgi:hypothetical protein
MFVTGRDLPDATGRFMAMNIVELSSIICHLETDTNSSLNDAYP